MIATLHYARKWLRPVGLLFVVDVGQCLRVYWLGENAVGHSVQSLRQRRWASVVSVSAAIAAWHCISSVNTDDSRKTGSYTCHKVTIGTLPVFISKLATAKVHDFSLAWWRAAESGQTITIICFRRINSSAI